MTEAYPLQWPIGKPRAISRGSKFKTGFWDAVQLLRGEVRRLGGSSLVISTNVALRNDGMPYANRSQPQDRGAAVYFAYRGRSMCFACDKWDKVGDNIYAIAMTIEALRGIERWGTGDMVEQAFSGFVALPAPKSPWEILGLRPGAGENEIDRAYREKARLAHPDLGGKDGAMQELNEARDRTKRSAE